MAQNNTEKCNWEINACIWTIACLHVECGILAAMLLYKLYFAFACSVQILWHYLEKRKDKLYNNVEQLQHLSVYICMYLSMCELASIASALNVLCCFDRGRHHGHLSWHWEPQWKALYPHLCGLFTETGLPLCCAQSPRGLAEHWAYLPSHVHLWYETCIDCVYSGNFMFLKR